MWKINKQLEGERRKEANLRWKPTLIRSQRDNNNTYTSRVEINKRTRKNFIYTTNSEAIKNWKFPKYIHTIEFPKFRPKAYVIDTKNDLIKMMRDLGKVKIVAIKLEKSTTISRLPITCLISI